MATRLNCQPCGGTGYMEVLTSPHDDAKETVKCPHCNGKGYTYQMTDEEENDYHADYW